MIKIKISDDFSDAPGARYRKNGDKSGEEFYQDLLEPKYLSAVSEKSKLHVDLDDTWGYATSFISESFGKLAENYGKDSVLFHLTLISEEDPLLSEYIVKIINDPTAK